MKAGRSEDFTRFQFQQYDYTCRAFNIPLVLVDEFDSFGLEVLNGIFPTLVQAVSLFPRHIPVYMDKEAEHRLQDVELPEQSVFIVGPDFGSMEDKPEHAFRIRVDYPRMEQELWSCSVLAICLFEWSRQWP